MVMSDCSFKIPFSTPVEEVNAKAKKFIESQGGTLTGDLNSGSFALSVFGNDIAGNYKVEGSEMLIEITEKPFLIPCSMIESALKGQLS